MPLKCRHHTWILAGFIAALPLFGQNSIAINCPAQAPAATTLNCAVTLSLGAGVTADSLIFGVTVTPNGTAPALTQGQLSFTDWTGGGFGTTAGTHNAISVIWANLTHVLTGTGPLGAVGVVLPAGATVGQSYTVAITGVSASLNNNSIDATVLSPVTVTIGVASLSSVSLTTGERGQTVANIAITGQQTNFVPGTTTATFGYGITVNSLTVNSATSATASVTLAGDATLGAHDVTLTTGAETATLNGAFTVTPGAVLSINKVHAGKFVQGQTGATYTVIVSNAAGSGPTLGTVTVTETPPTGMTIASMNGGTTWSCTVQPSVCTTSAVLNAGASYPAISVAVNVAGDAEASLTNIVSVSAAGSPTASAGDPTAVTSPCDIDQDGAMGLPDVLKSVQEALGKISPGHDLNSDGAVNVVDIQMVINGATGRGCVVQ